MKPLISACALIVFLECFPLRASTIAYEDPAGQGTQSWTGNLALTFNVIHPVLVTDLGVFNASGSGTITGTIDVAIFQGSTEVVGPVAFNGTYTPQGSGFDVFQAITPVYLSPGAYEVDAVGFSGADMNGNLNLGSSSGPALNTGGGLLTFTGAAYDGNGSLDAPATCASCKTAPSPQDQQFDAGTFMFEAATPEPSTGILIVCGLALVASRRRKVA